MGGRPRTGALASAACALVLGAGLLAGQAAARPSTSCGHLTYQHHRFTVIEHNTGCSFARKHANSYLFHHKHVSGYTCAKYSASSNLLLYCAHSTPTRDTPRFYVER